MADPLITRFEPDSTLLAPLLEAAHYELSQDEEASWNPDWPGNILSKRIVVYGDGTIARLGDPVRFAVDPAELALCRRLAAEAMEVAEGLEVGGTSDNVFGQFYNSASEGVPAPGRIDSESVRTRFGGTIFPWAEVAVEPMAEAGEWWARKEEGYEPDDPRFEQWKRLIRWFRDRPEFVAAAYVRIGDNLELEHRSPDVPDDVSSFGVIMPRLIVGLTYRGSLAGLAGCAVLA